MMKLPTCLLPGPSCVPLENYRIDEIEGCIRLTLFSVQAHVACPVCQETTQRVHSLYTRHFADLPWAGVPVQIELWVRRYFCDNAACPRRIFTERLPAVLAPWSRRTNRLALAQQRLGLAVGGAPAARLSTQLAIAGGTDLFLRTIRQVEMPERPTPRVLGVDDWALRKGQVYGTILVDLETHQPVDLLADRSAETLANWLQEHPGVEIISRDRANDYAEGASRGAPDAVQVADRFHLLQNLTDTLHRLLDRHPRLLREAARQAIEEPNGVENHLPTALPATELAPDSSANSVEPVETRAVAPSETAAQLRFAEVKALQQQGWSRRAVAKHLSLNWRTVNRYWPLNDLPRRQFGAQSISTVTPYLPYLVQRWQEGCQNRRRLHDELKAQGYTGSYGSIWRATNQLVSEGALVASQKQPIRIPSFSARKAAWLLAAQPDDLLPHQQRLREKLCQICQEAAEAYQLAQAFCEMIRKRQVDVLDDWLHRAEQSLVPELQRFAAGLRRDYAAVRAALQHVWSNGQVEGQVNRLKLIKRTMYGRANFDLLRQRVLAA